MKATLSLEYIGEGHDARAVLFGRIADMMQPGLGRAVLGGSGRIRVPWVAEITGRDPRFGLRRSFLRANWQRKDANSEHTRGVYLWFVLESGRAYEVSAPLSWRRQDRYFCRVDEAGVIFRVSEQDACKSAA